jgi:hypothetical protein
MLPVTSVCTATGPADLLSLKGIFAGHMHFERDVASLGMIRGLCHFSWIFLVHFSLRFCTCHFYKASANVLLTWEGPLKKVSMAHLICESLSLATVRGTLALEQRGLDAPQ